MRSTSDIISLSFGLVMIIIVFAGAIVFSFTEWMDDRLYGQKRIFFILVLLAYGIYRIFRLLPILRRNKNV